MTRFVAARWLWLLAAVIALLVGVRTWTVADKPLSGIEIESLVIAGDLLAGKPSMAHERMAGYGMLLAGLALADPGLKQGLACRPERPASCGKAKFRSVFVLQYMAALAALLLGYLMAVRLSGSVQIGGITAALMFLGTRPGDLAGFVTANSIHHLLVLGFALLCLAAWQSKWLAPALGAGVVLGLAGLIEPHVLVLAPVMVVTFVALAWRTGRAGLGVPEGGLLLLGAAATAGAALWLAVSIGYDQGAVWRHVGVRLAERVAYNDLGWWSWLLAILAPVPLVGDLLQGVAMSAAEARKHSMYQPGSLVLDALVRAWLEAVARGGGNSEAVRLIWEQRVAGEPWAWLEGVLPVLSRGLWGGAGLVALIGIFHVRRCGAYMAVDGRAADWAIVVVPVIALLAFNALTTANFPLLNPALPLLYAYAIAHVAGGT